MRSRIAIIVASIAITLVILELGARFYLSQFGDDRQKILYLYTRDEINQKQTLLQGLAYLNYGLSTARDGVNSLGYRGPEIAVPKPDCGLSRCGHRRFDHLRLVPRSLATGVSAAIAGDAAARLWLRRG